MDNPLHKHRICRLPALLISVNHEYKAIHVLQRPFTPSIRKETVENIRHELSCPRKRFRNRVVTFYNSREAVSYCIQLHSYAITTHGAKCAYSSALRGPEDMKMKAVSFMTSHMQRCVIWLTAKIVKNV
jgi:hypothetical protein